MTQITEQQAFSLDDALSDYVRTILWTYIHEARFFYHNRMSRLISFFVLPSISTFKLLLIYIGLHNLRSLAAPSELPSLPGILRRNNADGHRLGGGAQQLQVRTQNVSREKNAAKCILLSDCG